MQHYINKDFYYHCCTCCVCVYAQYILCTYMLYFYKLIWNILSYLNIMKHKGLFDKNNESVLSFRWQYSIIRDKPVV